VSRLSITYLMAVCLYFNPFKAHPSLIISFLVLKLTYSYAPKVNLDFLSWSSLFNLFLFFLVTKLGLWSVFNANQDTYFPLFILLYNF